MSKGESSSSSNSKPQSPVDSKWAGEFYSFLKLFERVGGRFIGLVVLLLAWTGVVSILPRVSGTDGTATIGLPWISASLTPRIERVSVGTVHVVGVLVIALLWALQSGAYLIGSRPLRRLAGIIWMVAVKGLALVLTILLTLLGDLEMRVRRGRPGWRFGVVRPAVRKTSWWTQRTAAVNRPRGNVTRASLRRRASVEERTNRRVQVSCELDLWTNRRIDQIVEFDARNLQRIASQGTIGFASLVSMTLEEDEKAAKAAMQIFSQAITRIRILLRRLKTIRYVDFILIPPALSVRTARRAGFLRWWLHLDLLIYGSYLSIEPPRIWLNLDHELEPIPTQDSTRNEDRPIVDPLSTRSMEQLSMVVVDQNQMMEAYAVLLISLIEVLRSRTARRRRLAEGKESRFPTFLQMTYHWRFDKLSYSSDDQKAIAAHLIEEVLFRIPSPKGTRTEQSLVMDTRLVDDHKPAGTVELYPTARAALVEYSLEWVDEQIREFADESEVRSLLLLDVLNKCLELAPDHTGIYYRLAVVHCSCGHPQAAWKTLQDGLARSRDLRWANRLGLHIQAARSSLRLSSAKNLDYARSAVQAAQVIAEDRTFQTQLRDQFRETMDYKLLEYRSRARSDTVDVSAGMALLLRVLDLELPGAPGPDPEPANQTETISAV